jgi:serine/threonine protein kinase
MSASTQGCGSPRWMAPEMTRPEKYDLTIKEAHAKPIDVWSFGMTVLASIGFLSTLFTSLNIFLRNLSLAKILIQSCWTRGPQ